MHNVRVRTLAFHAHPLLAVRRWRVRMGYLGVKAARCTVGSDQGIAWKIRDAVGDKGYFLHKYCPEPKKPGRKAGLN